MRYLGIVGGIFVALFAVGVAFADTTIALNSRDNSGISGTAVLIPRGNQTEVSIKITGAPANASEPANIYVYQGCGGDSPPRGVVYPLKNVVGGSSDTAIDATLDSVTSGSYAILVSESAANPSNWLACGSIPIVAALPKSGGVPLGFVALLAFAMLGSGFYMRRGR